MTAVCIPTTPDRFAYVTLLRLCLYYFSTFDAQFVTNANSLDYVMCPVQCWE